MSQYEITTERLVTVIHSMKLGQRSGELIARRGEGGMLEEGTVFFVNGQMTQAAVGRRSGLAAFNHLCTWGYCRYTFLSSVSGEVRPVHLPTVFPAERLLAATDTISEAQHPRAPGTNALTREQMSSPPHAYGVNNGDVARERSAGNRIVLRSTRPLHEVLHLVEQQRLSRSHRQLFLLIDGQRSLAELMLLMRRNDSEIRRLLLDLEHLGVIEIGGN